MPSPAIDFRAIRPHHGSQHSGFEELVCQLAALDTSPRLAFHRKGAGADAGLECYRTEADGSETGWQAKYFFEFGSSEGSQLKESFENAVHHHPNLARFIVSMPFNLPDGRSANRKSQKDRWNDWVAARARAILPRIVAIELWDETRLIEHLTRTDPRHAGRRRYWFDLLHFTPDWFRTRFDITRAALGKRYTPELNIELPVRRGLLAFARDPDFIEELRGLADTVDAARHRGTGDVVKLLANGPAAAPAAGLDAAFRAISLSIRASAMGPADTISFDLWSQTVDQASTILGNCVAEVWNLHSQNAAHRNSIQRGHHHVNQLYEALHAVSRAINSHETQLANAHRLLVTGEAGIGKSHLLADVAQHHIAHGYPAVLVLGGSLVDGEIWRQVGDQLGLTNVSADELLGALDAAGQAEGTRALIMIDAINERGGIAIWKERLAAFLATAERFRHVALVLSCRTTFLPYIVTDIDDNLLPRLPHPGFAGRAAQAAQLYLDQRGIVRMAAPNLSLEC
ncbi:ATP-binding protein [Sphingobium yanoikuyae]|uniref:ATP-binding protein n=1 Tax=Sphingobium yanoikuyae TaxID=13690 RepID=UPI00289E6D08|nr:ATP-binding protein [Sphingobium yanoikuyae]